MRIQRVLLVCSGNTCRSPMAAALLRHLWKEAGAEWPLDVVSAGTGALNGMETSEHARTAMQQRNLDLSDHRSQRTTAELLGGVDLVLTMTERHKELVTSTWPQCQAKAYTLREYANAGEDVGDPYGGSLQDYENTAATLEVMLKAAVARIRREGTSAQ